MIAFCPLTLWCVADISSVSTWYIWQFDPNCHMHWYSGSFTCWPPRSQRPWVVRIFSINFQTFIHLYAYVENFCCVLHTEPSISLTQWFDWLGLIFTLPVVWFHSPLSHFSATCNGPPNLCGATGFTCHRKISGYWGLGEPSRRGIMCHQVAMVTDVRRSPPLNWGSKIHVKRLDKSWECWQT